MLTLNTIAEERSFTRQADEYMPLKVEFLPPLTSVDDIYYWRSTNSRLYQLEVALAAETGALSTINLVLIPHDWILRGTSIKDLCGVGSRKQGLPVFHLDPWKERTGPKEPGADPMLRIHDEQVPFKLHIAPDGAAILFDNFDPSYTVVNKELRFCFTARHEWCGLISEK